MGLFIHPHMLGSPFTVREQSFILLFLLSLLLTHLEPAVVHTLCTTRKRQFLLPGVCKLNKQEMQNAGDAAIPERCLTKVMKEPKNWNVVWWNAFRVMNRLKIRYWVDLCWKQGLWMWNQLWVVHKTNIQPSLCMETKGYYGV